MEVKVEISLIDQKTEKCNTMVILNRDPQILSVDKRMKSVSKFKHISVSTHKELYCINYSENKVTVFLKRS